MLRNTLFIEIDKKIAETLGLQIDVDWLWSSAWEMMERRVRGVGKTVRPGTEILVEVEIGEKEKA